MPEVSVEPRNQTEAGENRGEWASMRASVVSATGKLKSQRYKGTEIIKHI